MYVVMSPSSPAGPKLKNVNKRNRKEGTWFVMCFRVSLRDLASECLSIDCTCQGRSIATRGLDYEAL